MNAMTLSLLLLCRAPPAPASYPVGVPQQSAVGNRAVGWVHIETRVVREGAGYRYHFDFHSKARVDVRVRWGVIWEMGGNPPYPLSAGLDNGLSVPSARPPVWRTGVVTLEVLENGRWRRVGAWHQAGPVPQGSP